MCGIVSGKVVFDVVMVLVGFVVYVGYYVYDFFVVYMYVKGIVDIVIGVGGFYDMFGCVDFDYFVFDQCCGWVDLNVGVVGYVV